MSKSSVPKFIRSALLSVGPLYHISFKDSLEGLWVPGTQAGSDEPGEHEESSWEYPEPSMTAISTALTIEGCFLGVFPNVARFFQKDKLPWMNFYVYTPVFEGHERVVTQATLTKGKWVWDAHVSGEYRILDKVQMKLVGEVKIFNTNKASMIMTHPYGESALGQESAGPSVIKYEWVKEPT